MNLTLIRAHARQLVSDNATGLLTAGGAAGTVLTAVLTARASFKAAELIREQQVVAAEELNNKKSPEGRVNLTPNDLLEWYDVELPLNEKIKASWHAFIPPVVVCAATVSSTIMANRLNAQRVAALAAAYSLSEGRLKEYQNKVAEKLSGPKNQAVYDEIAQDQVRANPPNREVMVLGGNDVLCFDQFTGRYFKSSMEKIKKAEISTNAEIFNHQYASLSHFYDELEIPPTTFSDEVGWNQVTTGPLDLRYSTVMSPDDKPCIAIDFSVMPQPNYSQSF